jgi:hypothetical protein
MSVLWTQGAVAAQPAVAPPEKIEAMISSGFERCEARVAAHAQRAEQAEHTASILLITGTVVAALGSMLAGFLSQTNLRKVTAVLGAIGSVVAVMHKTFDDPAEVRVIQKNAERHHDVALKVNRQRHFIKSDEYQLALAHYVVVRLSDCEAGTVPEKVDELPPPPGGEIVLPTNELQP